MHWQHIHADRVPWRDHGEGRAVRALLSAPLRVDEWRHVPGAQERFAGIGLLAAGSAVLGDQPVAAGSLCWQREPVALTAGAAGLRLYRLEPPAALAPAVASFVIDPASVPWQQFEDPAGRPTQPVQVLLDGSLAVLRTRFAPGFEAGEHWHDFDTLYFITDGTMQFGHEGEYQTGDVRHVSGGYSYGPEKPGATGVEFVLFSLGGPVALHWADLEPPPRGVLP